MFRERPAPAPHDVMESTPIHAKGETIRDRSSRLSTILPHAASTAAGWAVDEGRTMGPPAAIPRDRRHNFAPRGVAQQTADPENFVGGKPSFQPEDLSGKFDCPARRETFVKLDSAAASWTPQKLTDEEPPVRKAWNGSSEANGNSLLSAETVAVTKGLKELPQLTEVEADLDEMGIDYSFQLDSCALSPPRDKREGQVEAEETAKATDVTINVGIPRIVEEDEPINLSVKTKERQQSFYQPEVSDIRYRNFYHDKSFYLREKKEQEAEFLVRLQVL